MTTIAAIRFNPNLGLQALPTVRKCANAAICRKFQSQPRATGSSDRRSYIVALQAEES